MAKSTNREMDREAIWRRILRDHAYSGLSIRQFCRDNDLTESAFYFWRRELQRRETQRSQEQRRPPVPKERRDSGGAVRTASQAAAPSFVPVSVSAPVGPETARIEIVLPGGARVHVAAGVERQALADVLAVLREAPTC